MKPTSPLTAQLPLNCLLLIHPSLHNSSSSLVSPFATSYSENIRTIIKMKWGRKKSSSLISRVFAISWLRKLRNKSVISDPTLAKKQKGKWDLPSPSSLAPASCKHGSLCSTDYGGERIQGRMSTGGINSILYDSDDEIDFPVRGFQSFDDTVLDIKRMKEKQHQVRFQDGHTKFTTNDENSRSNSRVLKEKRVELEKWSNKEEKSSTLAEKDMLEIEMTGKDFHKSTGSNERRQHKFSLPDSNLSTIHENSAFWTRNLDDFNETSKKISSSECQEMKKARKKSKMKTKEKAVEGRPVFDSFAVVKTSFDPRKDFRDSMVEMIMEKGIQRPEELEELLACYLQLNCDEYHDLIIKVFRQVCFDMNSMYIDPVIHNDHCFGNY